MNEKLIFKAIVGSTAYGTNVPGSDIDHKGIYLQDHKDILTFKYKPQIEVGKDECYYEGKRFIELCQTANPTVLEMLYMPLDTIVSQTAEYDILVAVREKFLTKKCLNSFGGYAVQQIKKAKGLEKKMNWENQRVERKTPIDFCYITTDGKSEEFAHWAKHNAVIQDYCGLAKIDHFKDTYALYWDSAGQFGMSDRIPYKGIANEDSNELRLSSIPKGLRPKATLYYNKDGYTQHCKAYNSYQTWLKERNTQRYVDIEGHGQRIDGKNMLHCRRLLDMAMEIAREGTINVRRPNAEALIDIRKGRVDLDKIISQAEEDLLSLNDLYAKSGLPDDVDFEFCNDLLLELRYA